MLLRLLALLFVLLSTSACQSITTEPVTPDHDYFPLETGRYIIYDVEEQQYSLNANPIRRTYQLKETVGVAYTDVTGQTAYRLMRHRRTTEYEQWQADSVWSARIVNNEAIRSENGLDFVTLLFPVKDGLVWDGNEHNGRDSDDYEVRNIGQPFRVVDREFGKTVTVVAQDDSTLTTQDKRIEVYARQIGLIYKERAQLQFCTATPACTGRYQIDYGLRQVYRIRAYGNE